ncbi:MAG TPA: glucokinase [Sphingomicrobium sp.]|nr:glucokinase [Sphingomicrobium sp.]
MSRTIAVADIGGTNARFALAAIDGRDARLLGEPVTLATSDYPSFGDAWRAFAHANPDAEPNALGLAFAGPVDGGDIRLTNNAWSIDRDSLGALGIDFSVIVNDFGAIAHAVATLGDAHFEPLCGPAGPLSRHGVTTIVGPGTGLGVAMVVARDGDWTVIETEGGHVDFAPTDAVEDAILSYLRPILGRVSVERVASGPGLGHVHRALSGVEVEGDSGLWKRALNGEDQAVATSLDRWCAILGGFAGDLALAHGADTVVIAGGLGYRLRSVLPRSHFPDRFIAKPPFEERMRAIPVWMLAHPQPGLLGAAVAFARRSP